MILRRLSALLLAAALLLSACNGARPEPDEKVFTTIVLRAPAAKSDIRLVIEKRLKLSGLNGKVTDGHGDALSIEMVGKLTPAQIGGLTGVGALRFRKVLDMINPATATLSCGEIAKRPFATVTNPNQRISACATGDSAQYLLDVAKIQTGDIESVEAMDDPAAGEIVVALFTSAGQEKWISLTREALNNANGNCSSASLGMASRCRIAIMLDRRVVSAPEIQGVLTGNSWISGWSTMEEAEVAAWQIGGGELPAEVDITEIADCASGRGCRRSYPPSHPVPSPSAT